MQETQTNPWQTLKTKTHQKPPVQEVLEEYARSFTEAYEASINAYVTGEFSYHLPGHRDYHYYFHIINRYKGNKTITLFEIHLESPSATKGEFVNNNLNAPLGTGKRLDFNGVEEMKNIINENIENNSDWENTIFQLATSETKPEDDLPF